MCVFTNEKNITLFYLTFMIFERKIRIKFHKILKQRKKIKKWYFIVINNNVQV